MSRPRSLMPPALRYICRNSSSLTHQLRSVRDEAPRRGRRTMPRRIAVANVRITSYNVCYTKLLRQELKFVHKLVAEAEAATKQDYGIEVPFHFGTMIEVVRACMRAGNLAEIAEFFSFGTNDLSQATFSFSREDAENKFLPLYNKMGILQDNPFEVLDVKGMGRLMAITVITSYSIHYTKLYEMSCGRTNWPASRPEEPELRWALSPMNMTILLPPAFVT